MCRALPTRDAFLTVLSAVTEGGVSMRAALMGSPTAQPDAGGPRFGRLCFGRSVTQGAE